MIIAQRFKQKSSLDFSSINMDKNIPDSRLKFGDFKIAENKVMKNINKINSKLK